MPKKNVHFMTLKAGSVTINLTIVKMVILHPMQRFNNEVFNDHSFPNN